MHHKDVDCSGAPQDEPARLELRHTAAKTILLPENCMTHVRYHPDVEETQPGEAQTMEELSGIFRQI